MSNDDIMPELKQILGAMIFAANRPLSIKEMRKCLIDAAETNDKETTDFAGVKESDIWAALEELKVELEKLKGGFVLKEIANGLRLQSDAACGKWVKSLLKIKPNRLSQPALETLAIIAYRQPVTRSDVESVRGVDVSHIIKTLMELQLVRIVGRSELPGRPFLYGTTIAFLEHFGLRDLTELSSIEPMLLARQASEKADRKAETNDNGQITEDNGK